MTTGRIGSVQFNDVAVAAQVAELPEIHLSQSTEVASAGVLTIT